VKDAAEGTKSYVESFLNWLFWGLSRRNSQDTGVNENGVLLFSKLMDSKSLFMTANCDTIYFVTFVNLSNGPMVVRIRVIPLGPSTTCGFDGSSTLGLLVLTGVKVAPPHPAARL
jgi:uncharacterized protein DUF1254